MSDSLAEFGQKLDRVGSALDGSQLRGITDRVAAKGKPILSGGIAPNTLSHWGKGGRKGGYKVAARYTVLSDHEVKMYPTIPSLGALLERGSGTTWKAPKRKGSPRRKKGSVGTYTRAKVPARESFTKGVDVMGPKVPGLVHDEVVDALRKVFG